MDKGKTMKTVNVQKEFRIPGTNIILEKGDQIFLLEKLDIKMFHPMTPQEHSLYPGSLDFTDNKPPLIYTDSTYEFIIDGHGLSIIKGDTYWQSFQFSSRSPFFDKARFSSTNVFSDIGDLLKNIPYPLTNPNRLVSLGMVKTKF